MNTESMVTQAALEKLTEWRRGEVQAIGAAISTRNWHSLEKAYSALRDKMDRVIHSPSNARTAAQPEREADCESIARTIDHDAFREGDVGGLRANARKRLLWIAEQLKERFYIVERALTTPAPASECEAVLEEEADATVSALCKLHERMVSAVRAERPYPVSIAIGDDDTWTVLRGAIEIERLKAALTTPTPAVSCSTCGATDPSANVLCSNGFHAPPAVSTDALCEDCPPVGYPTDKTRCDPCPRRVSTEEIVAVLEAGDKLADVARRYGGAPGREAIAAWKAAILSRLRGEGETQASRQSAIAELCEGLEGFVVSLTRSLCNRETMLTINHDDLVRRIEHARTLLSKHSSDAPGDAGTRAIEPSDGDEA